MHSDPANQYRALLEDDPPAFLDRVNTPWDHVPDLQEYNQLAYNRIVRALRGLARSKGEEGKSNSQGILVLGEAGTGKTHLLMRVARLLSDANHILFIRKPNNEEAVAQHVWANVVSSLTRSLPTSGTKRSQLDDLLAHVFTEVLVPRFEQDIQAGKDAELKQRWVNNLRADPYNLFKMLGEGEKRIDRLDRLRRFALRYLQTTHPDVDQTIAHVLITYCFVSREDRKKVLLTWLSGQDVDEAEAKDLGLPQSWVTVDESSTDVSTQQQREEQALRAIRTIGILSTYYQPLILAFDQLEGLRDQSRLTQRWGDTVREIFTMTPNFLVVTCIFPSLWESWFKEELDDSVSQRIAQQVVTLETFGPQHALKMLATHLEPAFNRHRLPTSIYPFTEDDVTGLCSNATSPRTFIQSARSMFEEWLDGDSAAVPPPDVEIVITQEAIDTLLRSTLVSYENEQRASYEAEIPIEQDAFGRVRSVTDALLKHCADKVSYEKATCGAKVMPPNFVVKWPNGEPPLCIGVLYGEGNAFAARIRNLNAEMRSGRSFRRAVMLRDRRCKQIGAMGKEYTEAFAKMGGLYLEVGSDEVAILNSIYDTLVAIEEHDLSIGSHEVDKKQFMEFLKTEGTWRRSQLFRAAGSTSAALGQTIGLPSKPADQGPIKPPGLTPAGPLPEQKPVQAVKPKSDAPNTKEESSSERGLGVRADVLLGDTALESAHVGLLGTLKDEQLVLAISMTKPQCVVLLGYMGSGKSYALGVLIENALLSIPNVSQHQQPLCVVAFNYRRNPEARFEYWGFKEPNTKRAEVEKLRSLYKGEPSAVKRINVFGYGPELQRRQSEYRGIPTFPIQFRSDELGAEHWEILMKPPSPQTEYMDVVRDIIKKLFYQERLTYKNLEKTILGEQRLSDAQRRRAMNRLSFAQQWLCDDREYQWRDVLASGSLNVFDLRMQTMTGADALKLCLVITDLVRRARNGVNKVIVFDEAHEYVDSKELVSELENAITQIRHDGLSFILASQFPDRIPPSIFKYLLTRIIFKLPSLKAINYVRKAAPNLGGLSPQGVSDLGLEQGVCYIQTDDDCTNSLLKKPQLLAIRPRCTLHGGETVRSKAPESSPDIQSGPDASSAACGLDVSTKWYVARGKKKCGPYTAIQLKELIACCQLGPTDMTMQVGRTKWVAASSIKGLFDK